MSKTKVHGKEAKVIAILTADWHLSHKPPVWRSAEPDWYEAMRRPLDELKELQKLYYCPILIAGDILDKWNSPAELINFILDTIPRYLYAVAGQHDIPNHNIDDIKKSAFYTISHKFYHINDGLDHLGNWVKLENGIKFDIRGTNYGEKILCHTPSQKYLRIAIVHDYVWIGSHKYPKAPKEKNISRLTNMIKGKLYGYDVIVYGDNHKGFLTKAGETVIFNCGTLMRRTSDEENYKPQVGLLYSDGHVEPHYLDISKDKHLTSDEMKTVSEYEEINMAEFAKELKKLGSSAMDFAKAIKEFWQSNKTKKAVQNIITKAMER